MKTQAASPALLALRIGAVVFALGLLTWFVTREARRARPPASPESAASASAATMASSSKSISQPIFTTRELTLTPDPTPPLPTPRPPITVAPSSKSFLLVPDFDPPTPPRPIPSPAP